MHDIRNWYFLGSEFTVLKPIKIFLYKIEQIICLNVYVSENGVPSLLGCPCSQCESAVCDESLV
jgi:hypothetical protein